MNTEQKARRHFHDELDTLQRRLMEMAGIVERLVGRATQAVLERDPTVAEAVIEEDGRVDDLEVEIDTRVMELLALHQPMAGDLRQIITAHKTSNDLERVGDHAVNMAKAARRLADTHPIPELRELREMVEITREMLADALASYVSRNSGTARVVCATDDKVDNLRRSLFRILVTHMLEDPKRIGGSLELLLVSQNLERVADLSTNVAEDVVFLVEGRTIKHGAEGHRGHLPDEGDVAQ
ncbi:MAG: phosphate signaling complex protein PhoU [Gemmatimonadetes bacterium]|nr:phosphate signaling complex protein PhoU [Gemmatimonadota bacterium]